METKASVKSTIYAKDIMYPRLSLPFQEQGKELLNKLLVPYPALPVVNGNLEVIGIISEYDILDALNEGRMIEDFTAESIMKCGHLGHTDVCETPLTVTTTASLEEVMDILYRERFSILPVVENRKLVGLITRKTIINVLAEGRYRPEHESGAYAKAA
ncbi:MAG TPA: CBS domain-containing protein [Thermodesulfovibrionales bacterium]|nr:CBS domain-containing protein [Thermodesulfovibrionales bacterium]